MDNYPWLLGCCGGGLDGAGTFSAGVGGNMKDVTQFHMKLMVEYKRFIHDEAGALNAALPNASLEHI